VLHQFLPKNTGGVELYTKNLSRILVQSGNDVLIFSGEGDVIWVPEEVEVSYDGLRVVRVQNKRDVKKGHLSFLKTFRNNAVSDLFERVVTAFQPNIIHFHHTLYLSGEMMRVAKQRRIPIVITVHDFWFLCHKLHLLNCSGNQCSGPGNGAMCSFCMGAETKGILGFIKKLLYVMPMIYRTHYQLSLLRTASAVVTPANFLGGLLSPYIGDPRKAMHVAYGIPCSPPASPRKTRSHKIRFGYFGAIKRHKGLHLLIEAFNGLLQVNATLSIYGDVAVDEPFYRQLIEMCQNDEVIFKGPYPNETVGDLLGGIDVLIVPSIWRETGPMVILEALAHHTPVIASDLGGMAELILHGQNGFLFEHGNAASLQERIRLILEHPSILEDLHPRLDEMYTIEYNARMLLNIYRKLTSSNER